MSRKFLISLLFVCSFGPIALAQNPASDSLRALLKGNVNDSVKVSLLNQLALSISQFSPDSALLLTQQALKLSRTIGFVAGEHDAMEVAGITYKAIGEYDTAYNIFDQLERKARSTGNQNLLATAFFEKSSINYLTGNIQNAMDTLKVVLRIRMSLGDSVGIVKTLNEIGNNHTDKGYYSLALQAYQQALTIDKVLSDQVGISDRYNNIARLHSFRKDFERSLDYFEMSYDIAKSLNDIPGQKILTNNIGFVLKQQGNYDEALEYLFIALRLQNEVNELCGDIYPVYNIGSIYEKTNRLDSASTYLNEAYQKAVVCNDQYVVCLALIDLGRVYLKQNKLRQAEESFLNAYEIAIQRGLRAEAKEAARELSVVYESLRQPTLALHYFKKYYALYDSLFNEENTTQMARLEAEYEFEQQKQKEALNRQLVTLEKEKELANAIWVRNSFIVGFVVLSIITFLIYNIYIRKNRAHNKLNKLNIKISSQKDTLSTQAEELKSVNEEITQINENLESIVQERTRVITEQNDKILEYVFYNSHQVRGPLARILGLVSLFEKQGITAQEMKDKLSEIKKEAIDLDAMVKQMNRTLEKEKKAFKKDS